MSTIGKTARQYLLILTILFGALLFSQIVIVGIMYFLTISGSFPSDSSLDGTFQMVVAIVTAGCVAASFLLYKMLMQSAQSKPNLSEKLAAYQSAFIIRCALLEAPTLLASIACFLTGNLLYLIVAAAMLVLFVMNRPTLQRISEELALDYQENTLLNDDSNTII